MSGRMLGGLTLLACFVAAVAPSGAQTPPPPPPRPTTRAAATLETLGTSVIRGRVVAADTSKPLRRAQITITLPGTRESRTGSTDIQGRYEVRDLPAGRYDVSATRSGYLTVRHGQRRLSDPPRPLEVADGQTIENIDFVLPRMSVISGRVLDATGEPIAGAQVMAYRYRYADGRRTLGGVGSPGHTDDTGSYRILSLTPGDYFVRGHSSEIWTEAKTRALLTFTPTYFGGTSDAASAQRVRVGAGQETPNIEIALTPTRALRIAGTALDAMGRPLVGQMVSMQQMLMGPGGGIVTPMNARVNDDGAFEFTKLTAGTYFIDVRTARDKDGRSELVAMTLLLAGNDIENLLLMTSGGGSLSGRIVTEGGSLPDLPPDRMSVTASPADPQATPTFTFVPSNGQVRDDFTFERMGLARRQRVTMQLPDGWALASVMVNGVDVIDSGLDFKNGERISGAELTITNQLTTVTGRVMNDKGAAADDATVVMFASAADRWTPRSRYIRMARPDQNGLFTIEGLPAGEYRAVAVDTIEEGQWTHPEFLASIVGAAIKLTLEKGARKTQDLRITRGPR